MPVLNFKPRVMKAKPQPAPEPYDDYQHCETETRPMTAQHYYLPDEAEAPDIANDFFAGFRAEYDKMVKQQPPAAELAGNTHDMQNPTCRTCGERHRYGPCPQSPEPKPAGKAKQPAAVKPKQPAVRPNTTPAVAATAATAGA